MRTPGRYKRSVGMCSTLQPAAQKWRGESRCVPKCSSTVIRPLVYPSFAITAVTVRVKPGLPSQVGSDSSIGWPRSTRRGRDPCAQTVALDTRRMSASRRLVIVVHSLAPSEGPGRLSASTNDAQAARSVRSLTYPQDASVRVADDVELACRIDAKAAHPSEDARTAQVVGEIDQIAGR